MKFAAGCAIGCAVLGIGLTTAGAAMGAFDVGKEVLTEKLGWSVTTVQKAYWDTEWEEFAASVREEDSFAYEFDEIKKLDAELSTDQIYFYAYDGNKIRVETDADSDIFRVKQEGDELKLKSLEKTHDCDICVYYPKAMQLEEMKLDVGAGSVYLEDTLNTDKLEIEVGAGELIAFGVLNTVETKLNVGTGTAMIVKMSVTKLKADCGVGSLDIGLDDAESEYCYKVECGIGSVSVGNETYEGISKSVKVDRPGAKKELQLDCGLGEISVAFEK